MLASIVFCSLGDKVRPLGNKEGLTGYNRTELDADVLCGKLPTEHICWDTALIKSRFLFFYRDIESYHQRFQGTACMTYACILISPPRTLRLTMSDILAAFNKRD